MALLLKEVSEPQLREPSLLVETGLLFEINRRVLHPLGLSLVLLRGEGKDELCLWDCRDVEGGILYDPEEYKLGNFKYQNFLAQVGRAKFQQRLMQLGFIVQHSPSPGAGIRLRQVSPEEMERLRAEWSQETQD